MNDISDLTSERSATNLAKRRLILRDVLTFLSLLLVTVVLFSVTLFLFRSFEAHREELGRRWSERGRVALASGKPEQAVTSLRTALVYKPGERSYDLMLAQALADAGHREEAFNYYTELWDRQPGSGPINLQLARLAAAKGDRTQAVNFYRAAIYGTWEGDGSVRRRDVRLELARYLLKQKDYDAAQAEVEIAGGNAGNEPALDVELGNMMQEAQDPAGAMQLYRKAMSLDPKNLAAMEAAGRLAFQGGDFLRAHEWLRSALKESGDQMPADLRQLAEKTARLVQLDPTLPKLTLQEKVNRVLDLRRLAKARLDACASRPTGSPGEMQALNSRWTDTDRAETRAALLLDPARQDDVMRRAFETEAAANRYCGQASGDDALLLVLAQAHGELEH